MTPLVQRTRTARRRGLALGLLVTAAAGTFAVYSLSGAGRGEGPLVISEGLSARGAPSDDALYYTLHACTEEPTDLRITAVDSLGVWSEGGAPTWLVAWPTEVNKVGAGPAPAPRELFTPVGEDAGGVSPGCGPDFHAPLLAAEFPHADTADVGFDHIRVHYTADDRDFSAEYEISFGVCGQRAEETRCGQD